MPDHDYKTGRLHQKYRIEKTDGTPVDPEALYFVLRYDADPNALVALSAYIESVIRDNPDLASDLQDAWNGAWEALPPDERGKVIHRQCQVIASHNYVIRERVRARESIAHELRRMAASLEQEAKTIEAIWPD